MIPATLALLGVIGCEEKKSGADLHIEGGNVSFNAKGSDGSSANMKIDGGGISIHANGDQGKGFDLDLSEKNFKMKAESDGSKFENNVEVTEREVGLPFYPDSEEVRIACFKAETDKETVSFAARRSGDPEEKILDFYREKLVSPETKKEEKKTELHSKSKSGEEFVVSVEPQEKGGCMVTIAHKIPKSK
jgi:hypothetical protein